MLKCSHITETIHSFCDLKCLFKVIQSYSGSKNVYYEVYQYNMYVYMCMCIYTMYTAHTGHITRHVQKQTEDIFIECVTVDVVHLLHLVIMVL